MYIYMSMSRNRQKKKRVCIDCVEHCGQISSQIYTACLKTHPKKISSPYPFILNPLLDPYMWH